MTVLTGEFLEETTNTAAAGTVVSEAINWQEVM